MQLAVIHHPWVWTLCWAVTFVCLVALGYNENARRSYPTNCITLCIFTVILPSHQIAAPPMSCPSLYHAPGPSADSCATSSSLCISPHESGLLDHA